MFPRNLQIKRLTNVFDFGNARIRFPMQEGKTNHNTVTAVCTQCVLFEHEFITIKT
jgi:hypothetical protein